MVERIIPPTARAEIARRLDQIESKFDVKIVYACESGSRAWGFESTDSDFDVRFLYVRRPTWYLAVNLEQKPDVIETPIDGLWDINGWDLRKALMLLRKSNAPLLEWLESPIVYRECSATAQQMRLLRPDFFSPIGAMNHYLRMAQNTHRAHWNAKDILLKKYFYVLRPLLACLWVEAERGPVPVEFEHLRDAATLSKDALLALSKLLEDKRAANEAQKGPRIPVLDAFIESHLTRLETSTITQAAARAPVEVLDALFQQSLVEIWGHRLEPIA